MDMKKNVLNKLDMADKLLYEIYQELKEINKEEQFDFCTNSGLSYKVDEAERTIKKISKIVYQK